MVEKEVDEMDNSDETDDAQIEQPSEGVENLASADFTAKGIVDADDLRFFVDALSCLVDEAPLSFEKDAIRVKVTDTSQIAMVDTQLIPKSYDINKPGQVGVNVKNLKALIKNFKDGEINFEITEDAKLMLSGVGSRRKITVPLFEATSTLGKAPELKDLQKFEMQRGEWVDLLKDVEMVSSHIQLSMKNGKLVVYAKGDTCSAELGTTKDATKFSVTFPLKYLTQMCPKEAAVFELEFGNNKPCRITARSNVNSTRRVTYYLAPRIES